MISVIIVSYNQEKYIRKAIESVLAQDLKYVNEIIIADDNSTDNTQRIISNYANKYPHLIKIIKKDNEVTDNNIVNKIKRNYFNAFSACSPSSDLIAVLEGDDYWEPKKLSTVYDLLYKNNLNIDNFSMIYHKVKTLQGEKIVKKYKYSNPISGISYFNDEVINYDIMNLSSCIYNAKILMKNISRFFDAPYVDYGLNLIMLEQKPAYFIDKYLSVYRLNSGVYGCLTDSLQILENIRLRIEANSFFDYKYSNLFSEAIKINIGWLAEKNGMICTSKGYDLFSVSFDKTKNVKKITLGVFNKHFHLRFKRK